MAKAPLIECIPNFSEGRDPEVIAAIAQALGGVEGAKVVHVDSGRSAHRTVMTVIGEPAAVCAAAFEGIRRAAELIDMREHAGVHARMGATDVCPLVPIRGVTLEQCAQWAFELGRRVAEELRIPVYLYGAAARHEERRELSAVRRGEYEGLAARALEASTRCDLGPQEWNPKSGAIAIGARNFLIAYNVNLNTPSADVAQAIARRIREKGPAKRDAAGKILRDAQGVVQREPGGLPGVRAIGWAIDEFGCAQVSCNLLDHAASGMHDVFEACRREAAAEGAEVRGSELIGLVPEDALLAAGRHYAQHLPHAAGMPREHLVELAVGRLGLDALGEFRLAERVLERCWPPDQGSEQRSLATFTANLSSGDPTPGGGGAAGLLASLGASLVAMVGNLTLGRPAYSEHAEECATLTRRAQSLRERLLPLIDRDAEAFQAYLDRPKKPRNPTEERARLAAVEGAVGVPLEVLEASAEIVTLAVRIAAIGNRHARSDAVCAAACAVAAAEASLCNVHINLPALRKLDGARADVIQRAAREQSRGLRQRFEELRAGFLGA